MSAAAHEHLWLVWFTLLFAAAGVFHHAGIKVPFFVFFGHDSGIRSKEPPPNMCIAMGMAAFICIFLGIYPAPLYAILPFPVDFVPYTAFHVVGMLQLLMFGDFQCPYCKRAADTIRELLVRYPDELELVVLGD